MGHGGRNARTVPNVSDAPWTGDCCSLVDAFRAGERSPVEELDATLAAIEASELNCVSFVDADRAREAAASADVSKPFGGVPTGIKELEPVAGWPWTEASLVFRDRRAPHTSHHVERLVEGGGAVLVGSTTASEFGGLNVSVTKLNGVTHNPWRHGRTVGGSSGGSAAAVAGGLLTLATGGDGGGSIRIPAGYTGLLGMKGTFGRIPRGPHAFTRPNTVVFGNLARSVRDAARYYDVCAGAHPYDPSSLPSPGGWEQGLGTQDLRGRRVAIVPALGGAVLEPGVEDRLREEAKALLAATGMVEVDVSVELPNLAAHWMMGNVATLRADLGDALAGVRRRSHRRDHHRPAPLRGALQPLHRGRRRGAAHRRRRGDGARVRAGRLRDRGDEPGSGVPRRCGDEQSRGQLHRLGQDQPDRRRRRSAAPCSPRASRARSSRSCRPACSTS